MVAEYNRLAYDNVYKKDSGSIFSGARSAEVRTSTKYTPVDFGRTGYHYDVVDLNPPDVMPRVLALNAIACALSTKPYTSVTEVHGVMDSPLCVVLGDPNYPIKKHDPRVKRGQDGTLDVLIALKAIVDEPSSANKCVLFDEMLINRNTRCIGTASMVCEEMEKYLESSGVSSMERQPKEQQELKRLDAKYGSLRLTKSKLVALKKWVQSLQERTPVGSAPMLGSNENIDIRDLIVNQMFSQLDLDALRDHRDLLTKDVKLLSEEEAWYISKHGIHVDLKAIPYMREKYCGASTFNVGIANADPKNPSFCCACCTAEREVLRRQGIIVNVGAISFDHFPEGFYAPSMNVAADVESLSQFMSIVYNMGKLIYHRRGGPLKPRLDALEADIERVVKADISRVARFDVEIMPVQFQYEEEMSRLRGLERNLNEAKKNCIECRNKIMNMKSRQKNPQTRDEDRPTEKNINAEEEKSQKLYQEVLVRIRDVVEQEQITGQLRKALQANHVAETSNVASKITSNTPTIIQSSLGLMPQHASIHNEIIRLLKEKMKKQICCIYNVCTQQNIAQSISNGIMSAEGGVPAVIPIYSEGDGWYGIVIKKMSDNAVRVLFYDPKGKNAVGNTELTRAIENTANNLDIIEIKPSLSLHDSDGCVAVVDTLPKLADVTELEASDIIKTLGLNTLNIGNIRQALTQKRSTDLIQLLSSQQEIDILQRTTTSSDRESMQDPSTRKGRDANRILEEAHDILQELEALRGEQGGVGVGELEIIRDLILHNQNNQERSEENNQERSEEYEPQVTVVEPVGYTSSVEGSQDHDRLVPSRASSLYTTENI
ncbi:hypothetical protein EDM53_03295, partial [Rickettsiales endosymbiont of Peranema trichophorum]|uniref:hypothetical protein n=1 Tax=Rickettsiales endosymbiont of Peranema trichophorum TaxID=2486577 RepID=UPI001022FCB5